MIQGTKPAQKQCNQLLYAVVAIPKYKKSTIYRSIQIRVFSDGTVSYLTLSTDNILDTTNN